MGHINSSYKLFILRSKPGVSCVLIFYLEASGCYRRVVGVGCRCERESECGVRCWLSEFYVLLRSYQDRYGLVTVRICGDVKIVVLPHWETRPSAL